MLHSQASSTCSPNPFLGRGLRERSNQHPLFALVAFFVLLSLLFQLTHGQHQEFVPTQEWQPIPSGQAVPPGLHIRVNLETGVKEAKLLEREDGTTTSLHAIEVKDSEGPSTPTKEIACSDDSKTKIISNEASCDHYTKAIKTKTAVPDNDAAGPNAGAENVLLPAPVVPLATSAGPTITRDAPVGMAPRATKADIDALMQSQLENSSVILTRKYIDFLSKNATTKAADAVLYLQELEDLAHQYDDAINMLDMGILPVLTTVVTSRLDPQSHDMDGTVSSFSSSSSSYKGSGASSRNGLVVFATDDAMPPFLRDPDLNRETARQVQIQALWLLGTAAQNNLDAIGRIVNATLLPSILDLVKYHGCEIAPVVAAAEAVPECIMDTELLGKAVYALSALISPSDRGGAAFKTAEGEEVLQRLLKRTLSPTSPNSFSPSSPFTSVHVPDSPHKARLVKKLTSFVEWMHEKEQAAAAEPKV